MAGVLSGVLTVRNRVGLLFPEIRRAPLVEPSRRESACSGVRGVPHAQSIPAVRVNDSSIVFFMVYDEMND